MLIIIGVAIEASGLDSYSLFLEKIDAWWWLLLDLLWNQFNVFWSLLLSMLNGTL